MPFCQKQESIAKPISGYPQSPRHIGEHLRKRRIDLGLRQEDVAREIRVSPFTIINWELGETRPRVDFGPRIIEFLGYDPLPEPRTFGEEVWKLRWRSGVTQRELARRIGVNESTVRDWEKGEHQPCRRSRELLKELARQATEGIGFRRPGRRP